MVLAENVKKNVLRCGLHESGAKIIDERRHVLHADEERTGSNPIVGGWVGGHQLLADIQQFSKGSGL
jgi:hypothetical protein